MASVNSGTQLPPRTDQQLMHEQKGTLDSEVVFELQNCNHCKTSLRKHVQTPGALLISGLFN